MKVSPHLIRLYLRTSKRYKKLFSRLHNDAVPSYRRSVLLREVRKLARKLRELRLQLRIAMATGAVVLALNVNTADAQNNPLGPFVLQDRSVNPLREPIFTNQPILTAVDFDLDGDFDIVAGKSYYYYSSPYNGGRLSYFENRTSDGKQLFVELKGSNNPFDTIHAETERAAPAFADLDKDGDLDLIIGQSGNWTVDTYPYSNRRGIEYYRNDGGYFTKQTGTWNAATKEGNPFNDVKLGYNVSPVLVDFDHDGDTDLIAGSYVEGGIAPNYDSWYIHYYVNDGNGNFTPSPTSLVLDTDPTYYSGDRFYPAVADLDKDGDYDLVIGTYSDAYLRYYEQESPGNFVEQTDYWDPATKKGSPFWDFSLGYDASPIFLDFNKDGEPDLFVGDQSGYLKYSDNIINYYENSGNLVFEQKDDFDNPFDGVYVMQNAAPVLVDLDGDGDLDGVVGNKYSNSYYDESQLKWVNIESSLAYYQNNKGAFSKVTGDTNPLDTLQLYGDFVPQFADVDGDSDADIISGNGAGEIVLFRNEKGVYKQDTTSANPFKKLSLSYDAAARLVDLDNDKDLDLVGSNSQTITYFINKGTAQMPDYAELTEAENPLDTARYWMWNAAYIEFADLDHDGDPDFVFNGGSPYDIEDQTILYFENTDSATDPQYDTINVDLFQDADGSGRMHFADYDGDGDLDAFVGLDDGTVRYLRNENEPVNIALTSEIPVFNNGELPIVVDGNLSLSDPDEDFIIKAVVAIQDYQPGETLAYPPNEYISGAFNSATGILTFNGKATVADYEALLRTVTFEVVDADEPSQGPVDKNISFAVYDSDFTNPEIAVKKVQFFINASPAVAPKTLNLTVGTSAAIDMKGLISDPNGNSDLDLSSLKVTQQPPSGAVATIDSKGVLSVDYSGLAFTGTETMTVEVCDLRGSCAQNSVTLVVTNAPPVISPTPVSTPAGSSKSINLVTITTDADDNLDPSTFAITKPPSSGAKASINMVSASVVNLVLDYDGISFHGTDNVSIKVCDKAGACTEKELSIQVDFDSEIIVYNAVAPNSSGDNRYMRIAGLPEKNKVSIFNRWGDRVFEADNYDNNPGGNAFRGLNDNGKALASGTYFYLIEVPGKKDITGYLTLKQ